MTHTETWLSEIRKQYPAYVTQAEFAQIAGICKKTAYKLNKSGEVPYREVRTGFHHHYEIRTEDVARFMETRLPKLTSEDMEPRKEALTVYLAREKDILRVRDVARISGLGKNSVARWIQTGKLPAFKCRNVYRIAKEDVISYLASDYYRNAHRRPDDWHTIQAYITAYVERTK